MKESIRYLKHAYDTDITDLTDMQMSVLDWVGRHPEDFESYMNENCCNIFTAVSDLLDMGLDKWQHERQADGWF